ncbi:M48 family metallopeptidase [Gilvimarinus polysaccharolyticus]|uniref:M48 family metallopeptidase n=1 Tax=Gilvimarinus polysaccharolyticus TaxID=863921 RepID=UPI001E4B9B6B|nr:SprT family zinc-dependent metalloprotease [Gilvimarinus polysaccharolyticus]
MADRSVLPWPVAYQLSARRRTVSIEVREGQVRVLAPKGVARRDLLAMLQAKRTWIDAKLLQQQQRIAARPRYQYQAGECLPYLGAELILEVTQGVRASCRREGATLQVCWSARSDKSVAEQAAQAVNQWYRHEALRVLTAKTQQLCDSTGLVCHSVSVRATRSKWGHCTFDGRIQYNWQIVLAPAPVVDYLVAHEVSHLRHHNHSRAFWLHVHTICPDYQRLRTWLRDEGHRLILPPYER